MTRDEILDYAARCSSPDIGGAEDSDKARVRREEYDFLQSIGSEDIATLLDVYLHPPAQAGFADADDIRWLVSGVIVEVVAGRLRDLNRAIERNRSDVSAATACALMELISQVVSHAGVVFQAFNRLSERHRSTEEVTKKVASLWVRGECQDVIHFVELLRDTKLADAADRGCD